MTDKNLIDDCGDDVILKISDKGLNCYLVSKRLDKICICEDAELIYKQRLLKEQEK